MGRSPGVRGGTMDQKTVVEIDPGLGVLTKQVDPNQLVTTFAYDSVGRLQREERPDSSQTAFERARTKSDGAWSITQQTTTSSGDDALVELDSLGRPVRVLSYGPDNRGRKLRRRVSSFPLPACEYRRLEPFGPPRTGLPSLGTLSSLRPWPHFTISK